MAQLKYVVEPFGEVNVDPGPAGKKKIRATILMEPRKEGTQTGIALDGSGSMSDLYGASGGAISSIFGKKKPQNQITPVAQTICSYLAKKVDADNGTTVIYWAIGPGGSQIEVIGDFNSEQAASHYFGPPKNFGSGTQLLPAAKYFVERFKDAPFGFFVFLTDGELHDLDAVKTYTKNLAREVAEGRRRPVKLVLIGIGPDVDERQMEQLDDLDTGEIDIWDFKLAKELRQVEQIFAEVVDRNVRVADRGKILDPSGKTVKDYSDTGVPTTLRFEIDADAQYFTLDVNGTQVHQPLVEGAKTPANRLIAAPSAQAAPGPSVPAAVAPTPASAPAKPAVEKDGLLSAPAAPVKLAPSPADKLPKPDPSELQFDLRFDPKNDVPLDKSDTGTAPGR